MKTSHLVALAALSLAALGGCTQETAPAPEDVDQTETNAPADKASPSTEEKDEHPTELQPSAIRGKCTLWCCPGDPC